MRHILSKTELDYIVATEAELFSLISDLCRIPALSHKEHMRAEFCRDWLFRAGFVDVYIDGALNVVAPLGDTSGEVSVFMAHMDTVFPDETELPQRIEGDLFYAPSAGDDTANLAVLLLCARYALKKKPKSGLLFVCNSCEEGLGNLKGCKQLMADYTGRIGEVISFDGYLGGGANRAVGSHRYRVTVNTEGGHSYGAFGNRNAIHVLAVMISGIYAQKPPEGGKTTYNVGSIEGGTSVNSIAEQASMLFEYRSDSAEGLEEMKRVFFAAVELARSGGAEVSVELLGERPGTGELDLYRQSALENRYITKHTTLTGSVPHLAAGSTDCNIPLSLGIPALCVGAVTGGGAHTYGEWIELSSLKTGMELALAMILDKFE